MIITLEEVKAYLRIDGMEDNAILELLISAAENYLKNSTGVQFDSSNSLAKLFCMLLVSDWYEHRGIVSYVSETVRYTVEGMLTQLRTNYIPAGSGGTA